MSGKSPLTTISATVRDRQICGGEPVFKGTRVLLLAVLASLAAGMQPKTSSRISQLLTQKRSGPQSHSRQPRRKRTFPSRPFRTFDEGPARREPSTADRHPAAGFGARRSHDRAGKSFGLQRFRTLDAGRTGRPHGHHTRFGFLGIAVDSRRVPITVSCWCGCRLRAACVSTSDGSVSD